MRWLHVLSGVMWIGLLWYFNFVQTPSMPKIPDEQKPAISKVIAPEALFWFRWSALSTIVTGLILASMNMYLVQALSLQRPFTAIGIGMWLGLVMAFNVWFIIWPNQKKALGMVQVSPEEKAAAAKMAGMTSRLNTLLSIPMLYCMVAQQNGHATVVLMASLAASAYRVDGSLVLWLSVIPASVIVSSIPVSLNGWVVREATIVVLSAPLGLPAEEALLVSVTLGALNLVASLPGALVFLKARGRGLA
jgi:uncharacterized membrane protein